LDNPSQTLVIHDFDGVLGNDALADVFESVLGLHGESYKHLNFWKDFLEPFYIARSTNKRVKTNPISKVTEISDEGNVPYIGDELINLHRALLQGLELERVRDLISESVSGCFISPDTRQYLQNLKTIFGSNVYVVSGSFRELISPILQKVDFDEENVFATEMSVSHNGRIGKLEKMVASGQGKINVAAELMKYRNLDNLLVIDDGTTGINIVNYCEQLRNEGINAVAIAFNPSVSMMQNTSSAVYFKTPSLIGLYNFLINFSSLSTDREFIHKEGSLGTEVYPQTDIGLPRTPDTSMPYGFIYETDPITDKDSIAKVCLTARECYKEHLVPFRELK